MVDRTKLRRADLAADLIVAKALKEAQQDPEIRAYVQSRMRARDDMSEEQWAAAIRIVLLEDALDRIEELPLPTTREAAIAAGRRVAIRTSRR
jgi:hypothetical protein